jgi:hypothetical protein
MKRIIRLNESDITNLVKRVLNEQKGERYMFFSNLQQIRRQCDLLLDLDESMIESILDNGHDWAQDHVSEAKNNMDQVFDFLMNESKKDGMEMSMNIDDKDMVMAEGRKKKNIATNQKLWKECLSWAKQRYDVCPSAYCNGAAVKRYNSKGGNWKKG